MFGEIVKALLKVKQWNSHFLKRRAIQQGKNGISER
jgi:hypothetical protein